MRVNPRILAATALTGALALVASPALAKDDRQQLDIAPWQWSIATGYDWGVSDTSYDDGDTEAWDAWDGSQFYVYGPTFEEEPSMTPASLDPAGEVDAGQFTCDESAISTAGDDLVLTCSSTLETDWGLDVTSEIRVLAPGDLARVLYLITNTTSEPVAFGYRFDWNYGESDSHVRSSEPTVFQNTEADEGLLGDPDEWSYNVYGESDGFGLNAGVAWGIDGQPLFGTDSHHFGYDAGAVQLLPADGRTIAAGETVGIVFFHKVQTPEAFLPDSEPVTDGQPASDTEAADVTETTGDTEPLADTEPVTEAPAAAPATAAETVTPAEFMAEFSSFDGRLTRGLPADVTIGNWETAAPELAETGADSGSTVLLGAAGMLLLALGGALVVARRSAVEATQA